LQPIERCFGELQNKVTEKLATLGVQNVLNEPALCLLLESVWFEFAQQVGDKYIRALPSNWYRMLAAGGENTWND